MLEPIKLDPGRCKNAKGEIDPACLVAEASAAIQSVSNNIASLNDSQKATKRQLDAVKGKVEKVELQNSQLVEKLDDFIQSTETRFDGLHREMEAMKSDIGTMKADMGKGFEAVDVKIDQTVNRAKDEIIAAVLAAADDAGRRAGARE